ncbi:MAG: patatin-like phospholipase family protein [Planctomycetota bacterium]
MPDVRYWGDEQIPFYSKWVAMSDEDIARDYGSVMNTEHHYITISGGGQRGAYGAGLLVGAPEIGQRPRFNLVTGISTGALIAPFAYLGEKYDPVLEEIHTSYSTKDLVEARPKTAILNEDALSDTAPLAALLEKYVTQELMEEIAEEYSHGRDLLIGTTNLDAARPVIWDVGRIAAYGTPEALQLIRTVMLASASIPGAFPPVMLEVEADGQRFDEMHVDGGATNQVFLYPTQFDFDLLVDRLQIVGRPNVYVLRNAYLSPSWRPVERRVMPIAERTILSLLRTQGIGDLYRIYVQSLEDDLKFHLTDIPDDFNVGASEAFDRKYMTALFELGRRRGRSGEGWTNVPPGYSVPYKSEA